MKQLIFRIATGFNLCMAGLIIYYHCMPPLNPETKGWGMALGFAFLAHGLFIIAKELEPVMDRIGSRL